MEAFCLFKGNANDVLEYRIISDALIDCGFETISSLDTAEAVDASLKAARLLVVYIENESDFFDRTLSDKWRYFQNEMRWKRKLEGDILLVLNEGVDDKRVPLTLRDLPIVRILQGKDAIEEKVLEILSGNTVSPITRTRVCAGEEALRLAALQASQEKLDQNGCDKDHVFESGTKIRTPYLERLADTLEKRKKREQQERDRRKTAVDVNSIDNIVIDTTEMDNAIKNMEKDVAKLDKEARSASEEIDVAAKSLSKGDVTISFSGVDNSFANYDRENLSYTKGTDESNQRQDPFGNEYGNRSYKKQEQNKKEMKVIGGVVAGIVFFYVFLIIVMSL